jgi:hypothetical protein
MLLFASLFLATAGASVEPIRDMPALNPNAGQPANCPATSRYEASGRNKKPKAQKLTELPDADAYRTVYRRIGGCEVPIIVKYGIGGH